MSRVTLLKSQRVCMEYRNEKKVPGGFGDFVCHDPISKVRDTIRKYEKDELSKTSEMLGSVGSLKSRSIEKKATSVPYKFEYISNGAPSQMSIAKKTNRYDTIRMNKPVSRRSQTGPKYNKTKCTDTSFHKVSSSTEQFASEPSKSYRSKTKISKIKNGIRITTDIICNWDEKISDSLWIGRKIDTTIPHSEILHDFVEKISN